MWCETSLCRPLFTFAASQSCVLAALSALSQALVQSRREWVACSCTPIVQQLRINRCVAVESQYLAPINIIQCHVA